MIKDILIMIESSFSLHWNQVSTSSKYILLLILVWLQIENEESSFPRFNLQFVR